MAIPIQKTKTATIIYFGAIVPWEIAHEHHDKYEAWTNKKYPNNRVKTSSILFVRDFIGFYLSHQLIVFFYGFNEFFATIYQPSKRPKNKGKNQENEYRLFLFTHSHPDF